MKTIKGVDEKPIPMEDNLPEEVLIKIPTYRTMMKNAVGNSFSKSGEEAVDIYQIVLKMKLADPDISLEDAQFKILKEKCDQNQAQWGAWYHAQVINKLKDAEKAS